MQSAYLKLKIGFQPVYCLETAKGTAVKFLHCNTTCYLVWLGHLHIYIDLIETNTINKICRYPINTIKVLNKYQVRNFFKLLLLLLSSSSSFSSSLLFLALPPRQ